MQAVFGAGDVVCYYLGGTPFDRNLATIGDVAISILQVSGQSKVGNLKEKVQTLNFTVLTG